MGYVLSVDVNKPYQDRATGIKDTYATARSSLTGLYSTTKQGYTDLYNAQKTSTGSAFDTLKSGQLASQSTRYQAAQEPYKYNLSQAGSLYQPARNEMYSSNMESQRALRERLSNIGASGGGGLSQVKTQNLNQSLQKGLTSVDLEQQKYIDEQNRNLTKIGAENEATTSEITAQSDYQKAQAMADLEAKLTQSGIDLDSELAKQLADSTARESSELSANELERLRAEQDQRNTDVSMYLSMYLSGRISKKQFMEMTGLSI